MESADIFFDADDIIWLLGRHRQNLPNNAATGYIFLFVTREGEKVIPLGLLYLASNLAPGAKSPRAMMTLLRRSICGRREGRGRSRIGRLGHPVQPLQDQDARQSAPPHLFLGAEEKKTTQWQQ